MIKDLNHVAVMVTDVEKSRAFYQNVLGLKKIPRPQTRVPGEWLGLGSRQLHLIGEPGPAGKIDPRRPHLALDVEDLEEAKQRLTELGIPFVDASKGQNVIPMTEEALRLVGRQLWLEDPDGNMIELREEYR